MSFWLSDPELFLYAKGTGSDDVHLWRCKKPASSSSSSSLVVPMESDDFEYVETVKNHMELIGDLFDWDETDYKRLVKYIYEKRLLVNGQGFVIAELLHKADKDGNKTIDDANEEDVAAAIYIRSLDVLHLKPYIPKLRERPIPLRTVKYLGDVNGKAALMEEDSKLTARVDDLESKNKTLTDDLESKNKTLEGKVTKLTVDQVAMTDKVDDLESKNKTLDSNVKTLEGNVTKLTADLVTQMNALTTLQQEVKNINAYTEEAWMNDLTNNEWVGVEGLEVRGPYDDFTILGPLGTFTMDENSTNVRARYCYKIRIAGCTGYNKVVSLEDLTPNKEKARFSTSKNWYSFKSKGKPYVFQRIY